VANVGGCGSTRTAQGSGRPYITSSTLSLRNEPDGIVAKGDLLWGWSWGALVSGRAGTAYADRAALFLGRPQFAHTISHGGNGRVSRSLQG
jgi:hypothetical protein